MQNLSVKQAYVMLVITQFLWASALIVARGVHEELPPVAFSFWRWVAAVALMSPLALPLLINSWADIKTKINRIILLGCFLALGSTGLIWAVQFTTATNASLVAACQPVVTAIVAWVILKERLNLLQTLGVVAALGGVSVMVSRMQLGVILNLSFNPGDAIMLAAVCCYAFYTVNLHRWLSGTHPLLMLFLAALTGTFALVPFTIAEAVIVGTMMINWQTIGAILFMALVPTMLATTMWNAALGTVGPNKATIFMNLLPVFGILLGVLLLDETLFRYHLVGAALVCVGISLMVKRRQN